MIPIRPATLVGRPVRQAAGALPAVPGHAAPAPDWPLLAAHVLAGVGSALLLALGVVAFVRRGSRSYLLVVFALAALLARTAVSALAMFGPLPPSLHHLAEHGLDAMLATLLLVAIYEARSAGSDPRTPER